MPQHEIIECQDPWLAADADKILLREYAAKGIPCTVPSKWLIAGYAKRLLVVQDGKVVGAMDLADDCPFGLPAEEYYPREVAHLRQRHGVLVEVCKFATDHLPDAMTRDLLQDAAYRLMQYPSRAAICAVHPTWAPSYQKFMGWHVAGAPRTLPDSDVGVILLSLNTADYRGSVLGRRSKPATIPTP